MSDVSEHPRFVCAREGHKPQIRLNVNTGNVTEYACRCTVCGRFVTFAADGSDPNHKRKGAA